MASPTAVNAAIGNAWSELLAPVGAETDVTFQCTNNVSYEFTDDTSAPEATEAGFKVSDDQIIVYRLATSSGLYARVIRGGRVGTFLLKTAAV